MASNYVQEGKTITLVAPYQRNTGLGALVGSIFGVALQTVANAVEGEFATEGVWELTKVGSQAWTQGVKIYWDNSNKRCTTDSAAGMLIGVATAAVASGAGDVLGKVRLNGTTPSTAEGAQAAEADLVDSSGGATANGTIDAVTAPTAQTDSSGGTGNATLAAQTLPTALTHAVGTADATVDDVGGAFSQATLNNNFAEVTTTLAAIRAQLVVLKNVTASYAARQAENRTAVVALTDAVKELSTKQNALLAKLRIAGILTA